MASVQRPGDQKAMLLRTSADGYMKVHWLVMRSILELQDPRLCKAEMLAIPWRPACDQRSQGVRKQAGPGGCLGVANAACCMLARLGSEREHCRYVCGHMLPLIEGDRGAKGRGRAGPGCKHFFKNHLSSCSLKVGADGSNGGWGTEGHGGRITGGIIQCCSPALY